MSFRHGSRVKGTSTTSGPGTLTVVDPAANLRSFNAGVGAGPVKVRYFIAGTTYFEVGIGTWTTAGPNTLSRDFVLLSSAGGSAVSLPAGTHDVAIWEEPTWPVDVRTGSPALTLADVFGLILYTGTGGTASLPSIASVPAGVAFPVINLGTGALTVDPSGTETINGATTIVLQPGEAAWIFNRDTATAEWVAIVTRVLAFQRNAQTGTTYTYVTGDRGKHVTHSNAAAIAAALPQAGASFPDGWSMFVENAGAGTLTLTPATSTVNLGTALVLRQGEWAWITSDGTNYRAFHSGQITGQPSAREIGTRGVPVNTQNAAYSFVLSDAGGCVFHDEVTARIYTIPANASVAFPIGTAITIVNNTGAGSITLAITTDTLRRGDGMAGTGSRTVTADSVATIVKTKSTEWVVTGAFI